MSHVHGNGLSLLNCDPSSCASTSVVLSCTSLSMLCFSWSHICSIVFKSGEQAGHFMTVIPFCARWFTTTRTVWALALSRWRIKFCLTCWAKGCTSQVNISVMYHWAFKLPFDSDQLCSSCITYSCPHHNAAPTLCSVLLHTTDSAMGTLWMMMDSLLMLLHNYVSDFVKQMNLKSINIVVFTSNAGFVFTFVLMWNRVYGGWKECCKSISNSLHLTFYMRIHNWIRFPMV